MYKGKMHKGKLDESFSVVRGISTHYREDGVVDVPLLSIKNVQDGPVDIDSVERTKVRKTPLLDKSRIVPGDIIITTRGTNFRAIVADKSLEDFVISVNLVLLRPSGSCKVEPEIVAAYLNSATGQRELMKWATGTTVRGLNIKLLKEVLIPIPDPEYQKNLSYYLSLARERKISLMRELELQEKFIDAIFVEITS